MYITVSYKHWSLEFIKNLSQTSSDKFIKFDFLPFLQSFFDKIWPLARFSDPNIARELLDQSTRGFHHEKTDDSQYNKKTNM